MPPPKEKKKLTRNALNLSQGRFLNHGFEGLENLKTIVEIVALGLNSDVDAGTVIGTLLLVVLPKVGTTRWQFIGGGPRNWGFFTRTDEGVIPRIKIEFSGSESQSAGDVRGDDKAMGGGISIVTVKLRL
jgi:hypothetical protein